MEKLLMIRLLSALGVVLMDNITRIRVVSGICAVIVLIILIYRMKKKAPR
jgi:L-asparagine transporter-like permease